MFHILVVDDDKNTRILMREILEAENYTVWTAADGNSALDVMDREHVDLVILDIMMPNMDGYEFTKVLRDCKNELPILMISAKQLPADRKKGYRLGIDDYMSKIQLMDEIWGAENDTGWETVTVHIARLRKRFEGWNEFSIESVRGLGYKAVKNI